MLKFLKLVPVSSALFAASLATAVAQDADAGAKVFKKCAACHMVGEGAKHKVGPELNNIIGRTAGSDEGYKYSNAMKDAGAAGLSWDDAKLAEYLANPKAVVKGTKMAFAGLKKEDDLANVIAYLKTFSAGAAVVPAAESAAPEKPAEEAKPTETKAEVAPAVPAVPAVLAKDVEVPTHGNLHLGRTALPEEVAAWDIDVRADGLGLPEGKGTVSQGEAIYSENCAVCHGDFGEGAGRWPVLAGGQDSLTADRPEKTIGSYWPYLSTVYDYVRRAMPFGNARSLSNDDVYALTAYLMFLNDVVTDEEFELSKANFLEIPLPNEANFIDDNRSEEPQYAVKEEPCMSNCMEGKAEVVMRARVLDVTPDKQDDEDGGAASID